MLCKFQVSSEKEVHKNVKPFSHLSTVVPLSVLTDKLKLPAKIPGELLPYMR